MWSKISTENGSLNISGRRLQSERFVPVSRRRSSSTPSRYFTIDRKNTHRDWRKKRNTRSYTVSSSRPVSCFLTVTSLWVKSGMCWILCISSPITYRKKQEARRETSNDNNNQPTFLQQRIDNTYNMYKTDIHTCHVTICNNLGRKKKVSLKCYFFQYKLTTSTLSGQNNKKKKNISDSQPLVFQPKMKCYRITFVRTSCDASRLNPLRFWSSSEYRGVSV